MTTQQDQEREAFEKWAHESCGYAKSCFDNRCPLGSPRADEYRSSSLEDIWDAWQARAALAQQAEPPELSPELAQKPLEQQAEPVRVPDDLAKQIMDALRDGLSVCMSVSVCRDRKVVREGVTLYAQTDEWCRWLEAEVGPKIRAAVDALTAAQAAQPEPQSVMFNGLTEAETLATASVAGLTEPQRVGLSEERWEVRVAGPDDVHQHATELEALRQANQINQQYVADCLKHPDPEDQVLCVATVHGIKDPDQAQATESPRK